MCIKFVGFVVRPLYIIIIIETVNKLRVPDVKMTFWLAGWRLPPPGIIK